MPSWETMHNERERYFVFEEGVSDIDLDDPAMMDKTTVSHLTLLIFTWQLHPDITPPFRFRDQSGMNASVYLSAASYTKPFFTSHTLVIAALSLRVTTDPDRDEGITATLRVHESPTPPSARPGQVRDPAIGLPRPTNILSPRSTQEASSPPTPQLTTMTSPSRLPTSSQATPPQQPPPLGHYSAALSQTPPSQEFQPRMVNSPTLSNQDDSPKVQKRRSGSGHNGRNRKRAK